MKQYPEGRIRRTRRRGPAARAVLPFFAVGLALTLSACGSSSSSSGAAASGGPSSGASTSGGGPSSGASTGGSTITVMTWAPLKSQLTNYPAIAEAAKAYGKYINDKGGINGHKLNVLICDEGGDPTKATDCARQAIQQHVAAVVGSFGYTGNATIPLLKGANIAWFGGCCPNSPSEYNSSNAFILGNGPAFGAALADRAAKDGKKKVAYVGCDGCQTYLPPIENTLKANGLPLQKNVTIPAQAQDYSPQASQALAGGTDAIILIAGEDQDKAFLSAYKQAGGTAKLYGPQGNLTEEVASSFKKELNGAVTGNSYSDISAPVWDDFRSSLKTYGAPTNVNYNTLAGLGTWAAYTAFNKIVSSMTGEISSKSFLDAVGHASNVDTGGMTAVVDFTKPWTDGLKGYKNLVNRTATFSHFDANGKLVPDPGGFKDYTNGMLGKPNPN
ncbi:MAG: ABC transporter substrate-binding protein [Mycobacteriales bacterium]